MEKNNELQAVHQITEHRDEAPPRRIRRDHADPTADIAIANVLREKRRKKRKTRARPYVGVWRAEEDTHEGKRG